MDQMSDKAAVRKAVRNRRPLRDAAVALLAGVLLARQGLVPAAMAAETGSTIMVEFNKAEDGGGNCLATMVAENRTGGDLDSLKLDLVAFDKDGIVAKRFAVELGPVVAAKTIVKTFPMTGLACPSISRLLVNGLLACKGPGGDAADCLGRLTLSSRVVSVSLTK